MVTPPGCPIAQHYTVTAIGKSVPWVNFVELRGCRCAVSVGGVSVEDARGSPAAVPRPADDAPAAARPAVVPHPAVDARAAAYRADGGDDSGGRSLPDNRSRGTRGRSSHCCRSSRRRCWSCSTRASRNRRRGRCRGPAALPRSSQRDTDGSLRHLRSRGLGVFEGPLHDTDGRTERVSDDGEMARHFLGVALVHDLTASAARTL